MHIHVTNIDASRAALPWSERWEGQDQGLTACWERGREKAEENEALATAARRGELVVLPWKGGVDRPVKQGKKYGTLFYLAMWQGLRGEPLDICTDREVVITCSRTGMVVTFTSDASKYSQQTDLE